CPGRRDRYHVGSASTRARPEIALVQAAPDIDVGSHGLGDGIGSSVSETLHREELRPVVMGRPDYDEGVVRRRSEDYVQKIGGYLEHGGASDLGDVRGWLPLASHLASPR